MNEDAWLDAAYESKYDTHWEPDPNDYEHDERGDDEGEYCDDHKMWHDGVCPSCVPQHAVGNYCECEECTD